MIISWAVGLVVHPKLCKLLVLIPSGKFNSFNRTKKIWYFQFKNAKIFWAPQGFIGFEMNPCVSLLLISFPFLPLRRVDCLLITVLLQPYPGCNDRLCSYDPRCEFKWQWFKEMVAQIKWYSLYFYWVQRRCQNYLAIDENGLYIINWELNANKT